MVRMAGDHHQAPVDLFRENDAGVVVRECEGRKREKQIRALLDGRVDAVGGTDEEHAVRREPRREPCRQADGIDHGTCPRCHDELDLLLADLGWSDADLGAPPAMPETGG